ncbi:MAG: GNAT family N-acetyltransferase [Pseudomonadota bacterium]
MTSRNLEIVRTFVPGAIGRIVEMHARYYARNWDMGLAFEIKVALGLSDFAQRFRPPEDMLLLGLLQGRIVASLILDLNGAAGPASFGGESNAHLRYFILGDEARGTGFGSALLDEAMVHADIHCGGRSWLTTFAGLDAARHLYESRGFTLVDENEGTSWGSPLSEQTFVRPGNAKART